MLDKLLSVAATNAKLVVAGAIGAALVAGGSAVAISNVADSSPGAPSVSSHASDQGSQAADAQGDNRSDTATAKIAAKPPNPAGTTPKGCHGAHVSAAAHTPPGPAHVAAVKAAAKDKTSCPKPNAATHTSGANDVTEGLDNETPEPSEPSEPATSESGPGHATTEGGASTHTSGVHGQSGTHSHH